MSDSNVRTLHGGDEALAEEQRAAVRITTGVRAGDPASEAELVERYSRGLKYLLIRRVHDDERARDLLQETFCIALEVLRSTEIERPERLAGYLRGIAIRVAMNASRKRKREPVSIEGDSLAAIPDLAPRPFDQVSTAEIAAAVRRLLDTMPVARDRDVLMRYYLRDEDKENICRALGLSSLHFNRVLFRAKARFRQILEAEFEAGGVSAAPDG